MAVLSDKQAQWLLWGVGGIAVYFVVTSVGQKQTLAERIGGGLVGLVGDFFKGVGSGTKALVVSADEQIFLNMVEQQYTGPMTDEEKVVALTEMRSNAWGVLGLVGAAVTQYAVYQAGQRVKEYRVAHPVK